MYQDWSVILPALNSLLIAFVLYVIALLTQHIRSLTEEVGRSNHHAERRAELEQRITALEKVKRERNA